MEKKTEKQVTVTINVTAADIKKGWPDVNSEECPIALACKRVFKKAAKIAIFPDALGYDCSGEIGDYGGDISIDLPAKAAKFSTAQADEDDTFKPKPFSFKLRVPQRLVK